MDLTCHSLFAQLYPRVADGDLSLEESLHAFVRALHDAFDARMVTVSERRDHGALAIRASSLEGALWLELHRLPQRWEGTVTSQGPASRALGEGGCVTMSVGDAGFEPWRRAARQDGIEAVHALCFNAPGQVFVLEIFLASAAAPLTRGTVTALSALLARFERLLRQRMELQARQLLASALEAAGNPAFITDVHGSIVWANAALCARSGHRADELVGQSPRVLQSGEHGLRYYRELWKTIRSGEVWRAETIDRTKDGKRYVVYQTITPVQHVDGRRYFLSMNVDATLDHERRAALEAAAGTVGDAGMMTATAFSAEVDRALAERGEGSLLLLSAAGMRQQMEAVDAAQRDVLEKQVAGRLRRALPGCRFVARLAPGEYGVFLEDPEATPEALDRVRAMAVAGGQEEIMPGVEIRLRTGHAVAPRDGGSHRSLFAVADRALANEVVHPRRQAR